MLPSVRGTRSVFAERAGQGFFLDVAWKRDELARYGLSVDEAQMVVQSAIGGENVTTTIEGRARYPVNVRYPRELRDDVGKLQRVLVPAPGGAQIPLSQLADIKLVDGPSMLRDENGFVTGYVYVDITGRDVGSYVEEAKKIVGQQLALPPGYVLQWSGQYENMIRVRERLKVVVPITLALIFVLLLANTRSAFKATVVMLAVPFSAIGAIWLFYLLGYNVSIAAWVGMIALLGLDAETGVFMLLFLDLSYDDASNTAVAIRGPISMNGSGGINSGTTLLFSNGSSATINSGSYVVQGDGAFAATINGSLGVGYQVGLAGTYVTGNGLSTVLVTSFNNAMDPSLYPVRGSMMIWVRAPSVLTSPPRNCEVGPVKLPDSRIHFRANGRSAGSMPARTLGCIAM